MARPRKLPREPYRHLLTTETNWSKFHKLKKPGMTDDEVLGILLNRDDKKLEELFDGKRR